MTDSCGMVRWNIDIAWLKPQDGQAEENMDGGRGWNDCGWMKR